MFRSNVIRGKLHTKPLGAGLQIPTHFVFSDGSQALALAVIHKSPQVGYATFPSWSLGCGQNAAQNNTNEIDYRYHSCYALNQSVFPIGLPLSAPLPL
jgi:hypothetical protein